MRGYQLGERVRQQPTAVRVALALAHCLTCCRLLHPQQRTPNGNPLQAGERHPDIVRREHCLGAEDCDIYRCVGLEPSALRARNQHSFHPQLGMPNQTRSAVAVCNPGDSSRGKDRQPSIKANRRRLADCLAVARSWIVSQSDRDRIDPSINQFGRFGTRRRFAEPIAGGLRRQVVELSPGT